jgi:hypothetical protein
MANRIRRLLSDPDWRKLSGIVETDEMYIGGRKDTSSRALARKPEDDDGGAGSGGSKRGRGHGRATVLVFAERGGDVRARRIAIHSSIEIGKAVRELIDPTAQLVTDGLPAYRRIRRSMAGHVTVNHGQPRNLALFNLAIDSKLRGCDVVAIKVAYVAPHGYALDRATVRQRKTGRPVKFKLTDQTRDAVDAHVRRSGKTGGDYLFDFSTGAAARAGTYPRASTPGSCATGSSLRVSTRRSSARTRCVGRRRR